MRAEKDEHIGRTAEDVPTLDVPDARETFFRRLPALAVEAKAADAPVGTLSAFANARFTAAVATLKPWFPMPRGH